MATLSYDQLKQLWIQNGGNPAAAPIMAAIALAESGGRTEAHNPRPPDDSYGLWQINYYGSLRSGRTAAYGSPDQLLADPNRQARAAISISSNGSNLKPWTTYTSGAASRMLAGKESGALGGLPATPALPTLASSSAPAGGPATVTQEGDLFRWHIPTTSSDISLSRSTARKVVGGAVLAVGGAVSLAGVFVLVGAKSGALGGTQALIRRIPARADRAAGAATTEEKQEKPAAKARDAAFRQERRDELGERREAKERREAAGYQTARAAGAAAADKAGPF